MTGGLCGGTRGPAGGPLGICNVVMLPDGLDPRVLGSAPVGIAKGAVGIWRNRQRAFLLLGDATPTVTGWVLDSDLFGGGVNSTALQALAAASGSLLSLAADASTILEFLNAEFVVLNAFDPTVSGLLAPVGARCRTVDGTRVWYKWGTTDYNWRAGFESAGNFGAGTAASVEWTGLACGSRGGVEIEYRALMAGAGSGGLQLWINGAVPGGGGVQAQSGTGSATQDTAYVGGILVGLIPTDVCVGTIRLSNWRAVAEPEQFVTCANVHKRGVWRERSTGFYLHEAATEVVALGLFATGGVLFDLANTTWRKRRIAP